jgi:hypothetical protein
MQPVRVKLYGLITLTRRGYFILLGLSVVCLLILLVLSLWMRLREGPWQPNAGRMEDGQLSPMVMVVRVFLSFLPWIVLGAAILQGIEAILVLRRFAREEALARARLPEEHLPPKP